MDAKAEAERVYRDVFIGVIVARSTAIDPDSPVSCDHMAERTIQAADLLANLAAEKVTRRLECP